MSKQKKQEVLVDADGEPLVEVKSVTSPSILGKCFHRLNMGDGMCYFMSSEPKPCKSMCPNFISWDKDLCSKYLGKKKKPPVWWNDIAKITPIASKSTTEIQGTLNLKTI